MVSWLQEQWELGAGFLRLKNRRLMFLLFGIAFFYMFPILLANVPHMDDIFRITNGNLKWASEGKPLADYILRMMNMRQTVVDMAPLPQIVGLLLLCYGLVKFAERFFVLERGAVCVSLLMCALFSPYLLENMAFRYEALFYLAGLGAVFFLMTLPDERGPHHVLVMLGLVALFSIYQPLIVAFVVLTLFEAYHSVMMGTAPSKEVFGRLMIRGVETVVAFALYTRLIPGFLFREEYLANSYVQMRAQIVSFSDPALFHQLFQHAGRYFEMIAMIPRSMPDTLVGTLGAAILAAGIGMIWEVWQRQQLSAAERLLQVAGVVFLPVFALLATFFPFIFFADPEVTGRLMIGLSPWFLFMGVIMNHYWQKYNWVRCFLGLMIALFFFGQSYSYGQATKAEHEHEIYITMRLSEDIMTVMPNVKELIMDGYSKESPQRRWAREKYPVFTWMMPIYLNRDWVYGKLLLELYGLPKQVPLKAVDSDIRRFLDEKPSARVERPWYRLYEREQQIIVVFKQE